jgi:sulfite reductase (NADPH) flavoprotein alpha-component
MHVVIPEAAPFDAAQRAWLNGFMAGILGAQAAVPAPAATPALAAQAEDFPWHDPALSLEERLKLAESRPIARRLMAAMGQLDCGQCGYLCATYAEAIASGTDSELNKCVPGGRTTAKAIKLLLAKEGKPAPSATQPKPTPTRRGHHRDLPVPARMRATRLLCTPGAEKETRHIELELAEPLEYAAGDSLGVWPMNNPDEVELIVAILKGRGSEPVQLRSMEPLSVREALQWRCDLRAPTEELYRLLSEHARDYADRTLLAKLAEDDTRAPDYGIHDVLDCLMEFHSARPPLREFVRALGSLQPRLYSIASSSKAFPAQVHVTVGILKYEFIERTYRGVASSYLGDVLQSGRRAQVFVQQSNGFSLPADPETPIIMIGPGTGIAPFRAFLQERRAIAAKGRNWLFFGNQRSSQDFFYRDELEALVKDRVLTRLSTAFSRDRTDKYYVQHRMLEEAPEVWRWLGEGAYLYVCGDAKRMASDVDSALQQIAQQQGGLDADSARGFLSELAAKGRYLRDVY